METTSLDGLQVSRIGLGAMGVSAFSTGARNQRHRAGTETIHRALDLGVTHRPRRGRAPV